ncbi:MAG: hypothetical protein NE328_03685, partial [Lentisphaeraceae bacterium]|nr:hypothetical protein [Lentisphaeraceae bacterium]
SAVSATQITYISPLSGLYFSLMIYSQAFDLGYKYFGLPALLNDSGTLCTALPSRKIYRNASFSFKDSTPILVYALSNLYYSTD